MTHRKPKTNYVVRDVTTDLRDAREAGQQAFHTDQRFRPLWGVD